MKHLVLQFNALVGKDHLPRIEELTRRLAIEMSNVREEAPLGGKRLRLVDVKGSHEQLLRLKEELRRIPSITAKEVRSTTRRSA